MKSVEETASRLDGVTQTSAGWETEKLVIVTGPGKTLTEDSIRAAFAETSFQIKTVETKTD